MRVRRSHFNSFLRDKKYSRRGFTLVELIVVLTIIAILAAVGVVGLVGYINKSHYDENSRNAVTVYQAAQNAIAAKTAGGTIDDWTQSVMQNVTHNDFTTSELGSITEVNDSYHKTIVLTYNPRAPRSEGTEDQALYDLLSPYFYDPSLFSATMSVEFDVSVTRDSDGDNYYTARVISAYYSKQNTGNSGWDEKCRGDNSNAPLPQLEPFSYRSTKSFVGYFDGSEASITGPVTIPNSAINEDYIFELRNGETLDITWGFFDDPNTNATFDIRLHDEEGSASDVVIKVDEADLLYDVTHNPLTDVDPVYEYIKYESGFATWTKLTKRTGLAKVTIDNADYVFPLTITHVEDDLRNDTPDDYTTYTISIDCLMTRPSYDVTNATDIKTKTVLGKRLFGTNPRNISAYLENGNLPGATISESYATRATDDPIYFTGITLENNQIRYCYDHTTSVGREINGHCVVNTLFGDLICNDIDGTQLNGSFSGSSGGRAVITSYRHLSNIRLIGNVSSSFKIARNLDWYTTYNGSYFSEVKVFYNTSANVFGYHSPVEGGNLKIVSFPAIKELESNKTLSSLSYVPESGENAVIYSINGVQLRNASFVKNGDQGYGLICKNLGKVYNIYTNNLNLVLYNVNDGSNSDYTGGASGNNGASICPPGTVTINIGGTKSLSNMPCGGLIGLNNGTVGNPSDSISSGYNTIRMSNCIVMSSQYWKIYDSNNKNACGGIIGSNTSDKLYGLLRVDGTFAVVSRDKCGGILGESTKNIGARFVVSDIPFAASDFTLPKETANGGRNMSCVVASKNIAGGAIGILGNTGNGDMHISFTASDVDISQDIYHIDITLPQDSLVINAVGYSNESAGGAIGFASGCTGDLLAIRVHNYGNIIVKKTDVNMFAGGVIGFERDSQVNNTYIYAYNHNTSRIGYYNDSDAPSSAGGVYGGIRYGVGKTYNVTVINEGTIIANGNYYNDAYILEHFNGNTTEANKHKPSGNGMNGNNGAGGYAGATNDSNNSTSAIVNLQVTNRNNCNIISLNKNAGGAVGYSHSAITGSIVANCNSTSIISNNPEGGQIGGAIGKNDKAFSASVTSNLELNTVVSGASYVGGVIGYNNGNLSGAITSNASQSVSINGTHYVGGAIGINISNMTVSGPIVANVDGTISGVDYLGGAVGENNGTISGSITAVVNGNITGGEGSRVIGGGIGHNNGALTGASDITLNGNITGTAQDACLGGFIGRNNSRISAPANIYVNGSITGSSNALYVSGGIGYNDTSANNNTISGAITTVIQNSVTGCDYIGGCIGYSKGNISSALTATIQNGGYLSGSHFVGGCLGYNMSNITGSANAVLNSDNAVRGDQDLGGCIGYFGSGPIAQASAEINTALPIMQINALQKSSTDLNACEARIGGVIGYVYAGTVNNISLSGTGGMVSPGTPPKTYYNSMWINGGGRSVGGVIGQISQYGELTNATVKNINVDTIGIVVTSSNDSMWIGGWIGSCFGQLGTAANNRATYNVNTVKAVYSKNDRIGGFCGVVDANALQLQGDYITSYTSAKVYANITMNLSGAVVSGYAELGGIFGFMNFADYEGDMIVNLMNGTRLGDFNGVVDAGGWEMNTESLNSCFCIEVGGAVGYATNYCTIKGGKIAVQFFDSSMLFAGGTSQGQSGVALDRAGVGGVFGSLGNGGVYSNGKSSNPVIGPDNDNASRYISVVSTSSRPCIYSAVTNTGGLVGYMYCGVIKYAYSTAVVFSAPQTGGGGATGGLIGYMAQGYINHCYVGGHTMGGSYVPGEDNVTGRENVGGFVGFTGEDTYIDECYTTASVKGTQYVGGFVGRCMTHHYYKTILGVKVTNEYGELNITYCTGRVTCTNTRNSGMYAGYIDSVSCVQITGNHNKRNKVLRYINLYNQGLNLVGSDDSFFSDANNHIYFADPGVAGRSNPDAININGGTYPSQPYDPYLAGSSGTANFPFRCFIGGTHHGDWPIQPGTVDISPAQITIDGEYVYNGSAVTIPDDALTVNYQGELTQGTNYYVSYLNNDAAGTATVRIHGLNPYTGMATATFEIAPANIEDEELFVVTVDDCFYSSSQSIEPVVSVVYNLDSGPIYLVEGRDFTVEYSRELDSAGAVTATITGIGNYAGTVEKDFMIEPIDLSDPANSASVSVSGMCDVNAQDTSGLTVTVTTGTSNTLTEGTDYTYTAQIVTVNDDQGIERRELKITVTGVSNYVNSIEYSVSVNKVSFDNDGDETTTDDRTSLLLTPGLSVYRPEEPTGYRPEYSDQFGWYIGDDEYDFEAEVTSDLVLFARWTIPQYQIIFDTDGDAATTDDRVTVTVDAGQVANLPEGTVVTPPQDGNNYELQGWYTDPSDDATVFDLNTAITPDNAPAEGTVIYPRWVVLHQITFDWDGDQTTEEDRVVVDVPNNGHVACPEPREGYGTVTGWYVNADLSGDPFDFENVTITGPIVLYPMYE